MAVACTSSKANRSISRCLDTEMSGEERMMLITSSMKSTAVFERFPDMARSLALRSSNMVRRVMTSTWNLMYSSSICLRVRIRGTPSTSASIMTPKVVCIWVKAKSWLSTTCGLASFFRSMTIRIPSRLE